MKKKNRLLLGTLAVLLAFGMVLAGCNNDPGPPPPAPPPPPPPGGPAFVNLVNEHPTETIWWFQLITNGILTTGESVEIRPFHSRQFQVPSGTHIAGVTAGYDEFLRQTPVTFSGGQSVTLVHDSNGRLLQR